MTRTAAVLAGSTVLAGAALLAAAPADARVAPEEPGASAAAAPAAGSHLTKAQVEHAEEQAAQVGTAGPAALVVKAQVERAERALRDPQRATPGGRSNPSTPTPTDPSSVPVALLALLGGGLVAAGAAGYTVYRYRHHGPVGAATA